MLLRSLPNHAARTGTLTPFRYASKIATDRASNTTLRLFGPLNACLVICQCAASKTTLSTIPCNRSLCAGLTPFAVMVLILAPNSGDTTDRPENKLGLWRQRLKLCHGQKPLASGALARLHARYDLLISRLTDREVLHNRLAFARGIEQVAKLLHVDRLDLDPCADWQSVAS